MMHDLYLSLGTNLGNREVNIKTALEMLDRGIGRHFSAVSKIRNTKAAGFCGPDFLNCVVRYECDMTPEDVLELCKATEKEMGRTDSPEYDHEGNRIYHDRIIDIDILVYGDLRISSELLTIPHPRLAERAFFESMIDEIRV